MDFIVKFCTTVLPDYIPVCFFFFFFLLLFYFFEKKKINCLGDSCMTMVAIKEHQILQMIIICYYSLLKLVA